MTAHSIIGGAAWVQALVLLAAMGFAAFELLFAATGSRRHFLTRRKLSLVACASVFVVLGLLPLFSPWLVGFNAVDAILAQYLKGNIGVMSATEMQTILDMPRVVVDDLARGSSWTATLVLGLFFVAAFARLGYLTVNYLRIRQAVATGCVIHANRRISIVASPRTNVPFSTRTLMRYVVVIPQEACHDPDAMRMYLGHELQHIRQGDVDAEILLSLVSPFLVLNPGYWFIAGRIRSLAELACDRAFIARERIGARDYSLRLLAIAKDCAAARAPVPAAFGVPLIGRTLPWSPRKSMLKARIEEIAAYIDAPPREGRIIALGASLALATLILAAAVSVGASGDWSHERIMLSTVVNLERINELNTLAQRSW